MVPARTSSTPLNQYATHCSNYWCHRKSLGQTTAPSTTGPASLRLHSHIFEAAEYAAFAVSSPDICLRGRSTPRPWLSTSAPWSNIHLSSCRAYRRFYTNLTLFSPRYHTAEPRLCYWRSLPSRLPSIRHQQFQIRQTNWSCFRERMISLSRVFGPWGHAVVWFSPRKDSIWTWQASASRAECRNWPSQTSRPCFWRMLCRYLSLVHFDFWRIHMAFYGAKRLNCHLFRIRFYISTSMLNQD